MKLQACCLTILVALLGTVEADTEKTVFVASPSISLSDAHPGLQVLRLNTLTSHRNSFQTTLPVAFPSEQKPGGLESWYLLQGLREGQRYEVRICWAATQPTQFWLETYNIAHVFDTPSLIQSLSAYADDRQETANLKDVDADTPAQEEGTTLFLHVRAAADYYSSNQSLMQAPPPVLVDIILDPFLLNILPRSLGPTAIYIVVLAVVGWYLSGFIWHHLQILGAPNKRID